MTPKARTTQTRTVEGDYIRHFRAAQETATEWKGGLGMGEGARQPRVWEDVSTALERARATQRGQKFNLKAGKGKKKR